MIFEEKGGDPTTIRFSRRKTTGVCALVSEDHPSLKLESGLKDKTENKYYSGATVHLKCPINTHISTVKFASFGTPMGKCGSYSTGQCHDPMSVSMVEKVRYLLPFSFTLVLLFFVCVCVFLLKIVAHLLFLSFHPNK